MKPHDFFACHFSIRAPKVAFLCQISWPNNNDNNDNNYKQERMKSSACHFSFEAHRKQTSVPPLLKDEPLYSQGNKLPYPIPDDMLASKVLMDIKVTPASVA